MLTSITPKPGNILIAEPFMQDMHFSRKIVLFTAEIEDEGDLGFIINQRADFFVKDVYPECWAAHFPVYIGGPAASDHLDFMYSCPDKIPGGVEIADGIYWGGDFETMVEQVNCFNIREEEIKFFVGYTGWQKGQLPQEIEENSWLVADNYDKNIILDQSDDDIWRNVIKNMGKKYAHIADFPTNPKLN